MQDNELEGKSNAIVAGMMGFKDGVNLRVSGTILAVGPYGAATTYSILADRINEDFPLPVMEQMTMLNWPPVRCVVEALSFPTALILSLLTVTLSLPEP